MPERRKAFEIGFSLLAFCIVLSAVPAQEIHDAAQKGEVRRIRELLEKKPELIDKKDSGWGRTALHWAARGVHLEVLTASAGEGQPTRDNLLAALGAVRSAKPRDLLVVYLSGHGVNAGGQEGDFFYLTAEARSAELADPEVRRTVAISSRELKQAVSTFYGMMGWDAKSGRPLDVTLDELDVAWARGIVG